MLVGCDFEIVSVIGENLKTACRRTCKCGYGVFSTFRSSCCTVNGVNNKLQFGAFSSAHFFSALEGGRIVFWSFTGDDFTFDIRLSQNSSRKFHSLSVNQVWISLTNVQSCSYCGCYCDASKGGGQSSKG